MSHQEVVSELHSSNVTNIGEKRVEFSSCVLSYFLKSLECLVHDNFPRRRLKTKRFAIEFVDTYDIPKIVFISQMEEIKSRAVRRK